MMHRVIHLYARQLEGPSIVDWVGGHEERKQPGLPTLEGVKGHVIDLESDQRARRTATAGTLFHEQSTTQMPSL